MPLPYDDLRAAMATPNLTAAVDLGRLATLVRKKARARVGDLGLTLGGALIGPAVDTATVRELAADVARLPAPARERVAALALALVESPTDALAFRAALVAVRRAVSLVLAAEVPWSALVDGTVLQAARESGRHGLELAKKNDAAEELVRRVCLAVAVPIEGEPFAGAGERLSALDPEKLAREARRRELAGALKKTLKTP